MRKIAIVTALCVMGLGWSAAPASASQLRRTVMERNCENIQVGQTQMSVCVSVNGNNLVFNEDIEALATTPSLWPGFSWKTDYIHLVRINTNGTQTLLKDAGPTGWMSGSNDSFSTAWYKTCTGQNRDYRSIWHGWVRNANGIVSAVQTIRSGVLANFDCGR